MHQLIASYLFQNKICPIPGLGTLAINTLGAEADFTTKRIAAPKPVIQFENKETDAAGLLNYIAASTKGNTYEVTEALDHFCDHLKNKMANLANAKLEGIGDFIADAHGNISFKQEELPTEFLQHVFAERVIHPKSEHLILVGDKETTNTLMAEFLNETPVAKDRWWIWAIVLGAIGLLMLLIFFTEINGASPFGNAIKI
jgi:hypothetical protein